MSTPDPPPVPRGDGCTFAILMVIGIILLLPGVCGIGVLVGMADEIFKDAGIATIVLSSIAVGIGGVFLLARARRMAGYPDRGDES